MKQKRTWKQILLLVAQITDDIAETLEKHSYAGVILFGQNTPTNENTVRLTDALQKANASGGAQRPQLLITTDQEGGKGTVQNGDSYCHNASRFVGIADNAICEGQRIIRSCGYRSQKAVLR